MDILKKVPVREQDPQVRAKNFEEIGRASCRERVLRLV